MHKGFFSLLLVLLFILIAVSVSDAKISQNKTFSEMLFLFSELSKKNLLRTEAELAFDSAIEQALEESVSMHDFSPESIKERIYSKLNYEINELNKRKEFSCNEFSKEKFFQDSIAWAEFFETAYLLGFSYFGKEISCSINSFDSEITALLPKGYTSTKEGFFAGN
ncbi:MAG: hypothetical protein ABIA76_03695 [Candidatus Diapherotrites archaeon]